MNKKIQQNNLIWVGTIINTHALKGELRIKTSSNIEDRFSKGEKLFVFNDEDLVELEINSSRLHKGWVLVQFNGFDNINQVLHFKDKKIYGIKHELNEQEFYYTDMIGYKVYEDDIFIGEIVSYFNQKAYDSFEVLGPNNLKTNIPILDEIIMEINKETKIVKIKFLGGDYGN